MGTNLYRILLYTVMTLVLGVMAFAAPRPLSDAQLDTVYAAGFDVQVKMGLDVAASDPQSVILQSNNPDAVAQLFTQGLQLSRAIGDGGRNEATVDPSGAYMPNLQNLTINNINIANDALKNATTLLNIFALNGDVAVGVNLNVIVNPTGGTFNVNQANMNWSNLPLSDALKTLGTSASQ